MSFVKQLDRSSITEFNFTAFLNVKQQNKTQRYHITGLQLYKAIFNTRMSGKPAWNTGDLCNYQFFCVCDIFMLYSNYFLVEFILLYTQKLDNME